MGNNSKAIVVFIMAVLKFLGEQFGIELNISEGFVDELVDLVTVALVWLIPNR